MSKMESIQEFYEKYDFIPHNLKKEMGHFNVFNFEPFKEITSKPVSCNNRDYFKITLLVGESTVGYANKAIKLKQALAFSNPKTPHNWEYAEEIHTGYFCIFDESFFDHYGDLSQYTLFQSNENQVVALNEEQVELVSQIYEKMLAEINSDYVHKYDVLRTMVYEIIHFALKIQPSNNLLKLPLNSSQRIATLFLELLERQFPIDSLNQTLLLRSASDYADKLNVHVNHLNKSIKDSTDKTTSQIIAERVLQEAKILLKQTVWTVTEIANGLGFTEVTHFNNFFKKHSDISPLKFRNS